jgi:uncharacterized protein YegL
MKTQFDDNDPMNLGNTFAVDFEPRCPIMLLLDVSNSMEGEPIKQLQAGLQVFANYLQEDTLSKRRVEVGICTFGETSLELYPFIQAIDFVPPKLTLRGTTPMGAALRAGLKAIEERIQEHLNEGRTSYRPWIFMITDGAPTDEWMSAAKLIKEAEKNQKVHFMAVGVEDADMGVLDGISSRSAKKLSGLDFSKLFRWVSKGLISVSHSGSGDNLKMPVDDWSELRS